MPRKASIRYVSLKSCLVNLPLSIYGPLAQQQVRPQSLAVHLNLVSSERHRVDSKTAVTAYVGWTGMAAASSLALWNSSASSAREAQLETLEIDPQYAQSLGFAEGAVVEIGLLHDLPIASSVSTEPLSADDWEILELHAEYVENNLLSQVRVASVGQEVDVWVQGRTRIRFRVVSCEPGVPASILSTNTEVVIAPKTRAQASAATPKPKPKPVAVGLDRPMEASRDSGSNKKKTLRLLPARFFKLGSSGDEQQTTLWVSPGDFKHIAEVQTLDLLDQPTRYVTVQRLKPPVTLDPAGNGQPPDPSASTPAPRVLQGNANGLKVEEQKGIPTSSQPDVCRLRVFPDMPNCQACLVLGPNGHDGGAADWDLISVTIDSGAKVDRARSKESAHETMTGFVPASSGHSLAGVDTVLLQAQSFITRAFAIQGQQTHERRQSAPSGSKIPALLLCGAAGSGRTSVAREVARRLEQEPSTLSYIMYVDLSKHSEDRLPTVRKNLQNWLDVATWHRPSLVVLDNLDRLVGPEVEHADSTRARHIAEIFISIWASARPPTGVALLATCQNQSALHPLLSSSHIFATRLILKAPDKDARRDILSRIVTNRLAASDMAQDPANPLNFTALATQTDGYSATDLRDLVGRAIHEAVVRNSKDQAVPVILTEDFAAAQVDFTPLSLRDVKLQRSEVQWSDIGGLHETRRVLRETLEWPTKYSAIFAKCPLRLRSGLLLYGFPGCGKTLLASAVAKECGLNFISVKGPELLNKYIGASEKSVRDIFDRASAAKPCVLFFDEFDSIAPKRGHDSTGVTDRVVNQMLTQMDGAEGLDGVYVLAATSRPDLIDPALLRPGRLDKSLLCNMPDEQERLEILQALATKIHIADSVDLKAFALDTDGYSGADLQALMYNAHLEIVHQSIASAEQKSLDTTMSSKTSDTLSYISVGGPASQGVASQADEAAMKRRLETMLASRSRNTKPVAAAAAPKRLVESVHLQRSLASTRPSVPIEERIRLERIYGEFVSERSGELPVPPESMAIGTRESLG